MSLETRTSHPAHLPLTHLTPTEGRSPEGGRPEDVHMTVTDRTTSTAAGALDTIDAAAYTGIARATLKKWRAVGTGPAYVRAGAKIVYLVEDLDEFLRAHRVSA